MLQVPGMGLLQKCPSAERLPGSPAPGNTGPISDRYFDSISSVLPVALALYVML